MRWDRLFALLIGVCAGSMAVAGELATTPPAFLSPAVALPTVYLPEFRFYMRIPSDPWSQAKRSGDATVCVHTAILDMGIDLFVTADRAKPLARGGDSAQLGIVVARCSEGGRSVTRGTMSSEEHGGLGGSACDITFTSAANSEMVGHCWFAQKNDIEYSIAVCGPKRHQEAMRSQLRQALTGLELGREVGLDANGGKPVTPRPAVPLGPLAPPVSGWPASVPMLGFTVGRPGDGWQPWPQAQRLFPEMAGGMVLGTESAGMYAAVTPLFGQEVDPEILLTMLLHRYKIARSAVVELADYKAGEMRGYTGHFVSPGTSGESLTHFFKTISGDARAAIAIGWTGSMFRVVPTRECAESLAYVPGTALPKSTKDAGRDGTRYAWFLNELGMQYYAKGRYAEGAKEFSLAAELSPQSRAYHDNLITALLDGGAWGDAEAAAQDALYHLPTDVELRGQLAMILGHNGKVDQALRRYAECFAAGLKKPDLAAGYLALLAGANRQVDVVSEGEKLMATIPSPEIATWLALAYNETNQRAKGIELLRTWYPKSGNDPYVLCGLLRMLCNEGKYAEVVKLSEGTNLTGLGGGLVLYWKGQALVGQKQYRDAKVAFEKAKELRPTDNLVVLALRQTARLLGESDKGDLSTGIAPVPVPQRLLQDVDVRSMAATCDVAYPYRVTAIHARPGEPTLTTDYYSIAALTPDGAEEANKLQIEFSPLIEEICINSVCVRDANGKVVFEGVPTDTYIADAASEVAHDSRVLHIPIPGLKPNFVAQVAITRRDLRSAEEIPWQEVLLSGTFPCGRRAVVFTGDTKRLAQAHAGCDMTTVGEDTVVWEMQWPEVWRWEQDAQPPTQYLPFVQVGQTQKTWEEVAARYLKQIADRLDTPGNARSLCAQITQGAGTEAQRIDAILKYVQKLRYTAIAFGPRARIPQPFDTIVANSYGDCKDHSLLLYHLLGAAGVKAHLVLVRSGGELAATLPSIDQFNHMICQASIGGEDRFYDATCKTLDLSCGLPAHLEGLTVLVLDADAPRLAKIAEKGTNPVVIDINRRITISASGEAIVAEKISFGGTWAAAYRNAFRGAGPTYRKQEFRQCLDLPNGSDITSLKVSGLEEVAEALVIEATYRMRAQFTNVKGQMVGTLPACWERSLFAKEELERRRSPMVVHYAKKVNAQISVELPEGTSLKIEPEPLVVDNAHAHGTRSVTIGHAGLTVRVELQTQASRIEATDYTRYVEAMNSAYELFAVPVWATH